MKNRKLLLIVSLVLALTMSLGGTLAYLTDVDSDVNVMTLGNVDITQLENGEDGPIDEVDLYPAYIVGNTINGLVEKKVTVKNVGPSDAYVRTVFALEAGECTSYAELEKVVNIRFNDAVTVSWPIKDTVVTIDDGKYFIACVTYDEALAKDKTTAASLLDLYMEPTAENDDVKQFGDKYKVLVVSQACQTVNMPTDPAEALNVAFGKITAKNNPWIGEDATNKTKTVKSKDELLAAIQDANVTSIFVDGALTYDWGGDSYANSKALLLAGKTITGVDADSSITFAGYGSANPITNVTLRNITVKDETKGDDEKAWEHGHLEFTSLKAENVVFANSIMLDGDSVLENCKMDNTTPSWYGVWVEGGTTTIKNCTFTGTRAIKIHEADGSDVASVEVEGCSFNLSEKPGVVIGYLNNDTAVTIKGSTFVTAAGAQKAYIYETDSIRPIEKDNNVAAKVKNADEMIEALENGKDVLLTDDIEAPLNQGTIYGTPAAVVQKGGVIDGNGNSLIIKNPKYEGYAIETWGGTIKNLTIDTAVGRGIVISSPKEDIYIDNVVVDGPGYAINTTEHSPKKLVITNSTVNGWTSLAGLEVATFTNCNLGENSSKYWQNMGYDKDYDRLVRPYCNAVFTTCVFEQGYYIDLSALGADCKVTLNGCTTNGTKITADNYEGYITIELPAGRTLDDCVIFK